MSSVAHWVSSEDANQSIFPEQVPPSRTVLQVPQTMLFSDVMLVCACFETVNSARETTVRGLTSMNWDEYWVNNPKGRHCLNGSDRVMLV